MSNSYNCKNNREIYKQIHELFRIEVVLQREANKMVAT